MITDKYRRKLRERLTGQVVKSLNEDVSEESEITEEAKKPCDFWKNNPDVKRNLSENLKPSPFGWKWGDKIKSKSFKDLHEETSDCVSLIKEKKETPKVDTFSKSKIKII